MSAEAGYLAVVYDHAARDQAAVAFELADADRSVVLTYGGLAQRVQRLGEAIRRAGFGDGDRIAVCMENRPAWPVAYLAVWYAGSVTVPLDPALDEEVLARLLLHSGAVGCVTSAGLSAKLRAACATLETPPLLLSPDLREGEEAIFEPWDGVDPAAAAHTEASADVPNGSGNGDDSWSGSRAPARDGSGEEAAEMNAVAPTPGPDFELMVSFDAFVDQHGSKAPDWRPAVADDETLGSIMYTSGTTGDPKGVMIRQNAVLENLRSGVERVRFSPRDRILGILPLFHVLPLITNCLGPLYLGARVVFLYELNAEAIMSAFRRHDITVFVCVPAFFYRFHDRLTGAIEHSSGIRRQLAGLLLAACRSARRRFGWSLGPVLLRKAHAPFGRKMRLFITGGAKMNAQVYDDFLDWGFKLAQGYGLTEATAIITATPLDELRGDTVGKPIDGVTVKIHQPDEDGIGEVWATGPSLMTGYYRNPEATDAALTDGWLRTGDLGRLLDNGHLQITGRAKDVIVLASGKNIYPDELEGYYGQSELVDELCIIGVPDSEGRGERLHAMVVPDLEGARRRGYVNVREMIKWDLESMGAKVPGPQRLTSLEIRAEPLPRTPTRKLKRYLLVQEVQARADGTTPDPDPVDGPGADADPAGERVPATTGSHAADVTLPDGAEEVCAIVARYAKVPSVGPESHLDLDLGMESLDRIELLAELQRRRGVDLDDDAVGRVHTVGELIEALAAAAPGTSAAEGQRVDQAMAEAGADNWSRVLADSPEDMQRYLRRRPLTEMLMFLVLRGVRAGWTVSAGFRAVGVERLPDDAPFMVCANHASYVDPIVLCMALPRKALSRVFFVGYSEYFDGPVGRLFGRLFRNIPIDPNRNLERAMQASAEGLRRGMVLVIFPEGARSLDGSVREFRRGAGILARHLNVPMVPAGIWGAGEVWPREGRKQLHPIAVAFGDAVIPAPEQGEGELLGALREEVIALVDRAAPD